MTISFYFDENADFAVVAALRRHGIDVLTVQEDGRRGASDASVLARAAALRRLLFTSDRDHLALARELNRAGSPAASVIFLAQGALTVGQVTAELLIIAEASEWSEWMGEVVHIPL